jgi:hypothetical protein
MWIWRKRGRVRVGNGAAGALLLASLAHAAEDIGRLPDPTRPPIGPAAAAAPKAEIAGPQLQSTMVSPTFRRAVISGRTYQPGDRLGGAVIVDIQPYEVTLRQDSRETRLRFFPRLVKEPKAAGEDR